MTTYYVATTGSGSGDGSIGDPYTIDQASGAGGFGDVFLFAAGTYTITATRTINRRVAWVAQDISDRPVISAGGGFAGSYMLQQGNEGAVIFDHVVDANGQSVSACNMLGGYAYGCSFRNLAGANYGVALATMQRCDVEYAGSNWSAYVTGGCESCLVNSTGSSGAYSYRTGSISNCVAIGKPVIHTGASGVLVIDSAVGFSNTADYTIAQQDCISVDTDVFASSQKVPQQLAGCMEFSPGTPQTGTPSDFVSDSDSPFVDHATLDLRLTAAAKSKPYAGSLKLIMAKLIGVPGITTDPIGDGETLAQLQRGIRLGNRGVRA